MILTKIILSNFQKHKRLVLKLGPGVNTIVGPSDIGKSAIIRAIEWVRTNSPSGESFIRKGAASARVILVFDDGTTITREKGGKVNKYVLNGTEFTAFGRNVPKPVEDALKISNISVQKQMDAPFLLSESQAEIGRMLNKVAELDSIEKSATQVNQKTRQKKQKREFVQEQLEEETEKLTQFKNLQRVETRYKQMKSFHSRIHGLEKGIEQAKTMDRKYSDAHSKLGRWQDLQKAAKALEFTNTLSKQYAELAQEIMLAKRQIQAFNEALKNTQKNTPTKELRKLEAIKNTLKTLDGETEKALLNKEKWERLRSKISVVGQDIQKHKKTLAEYKDEICPECGRSFGECND